MALGGIDVAVRVAVGLAGTDVAVAGAEVGVRVTVEVGGATVGVKVGPMAVGVRVGVGREAPRLISKERTADQAPLTPPIRPRTRHQKRRSLVKVCVVWVCVSPV